VHSQHAPNSAVVGYFQLFPDSLTVFNDDCINTVSEATDFPKSEVRMRQASRNRLRKDLLHASIYRWLCTVFTRYNEVYVLAAINSRIKIFSGTCSLDLRSKWCGEHRVPIPDALFSPRWFWRITFDGTLRMMICLKPFASRRVAERRKIRTRPSAVPATKPNTQWANCLKSLGEYYQQIAFILQRTLPFFHKYLPFFS